MGKIYPEIRTADTPQLPSAAVESISSMPSMPWISSSMRTQTPSSTSSGAAPRKGTRIDTTSTLMSGKLFWLIWPTETRPPTMSTTISRFAAT